MASKSLDLNTAYLWPAPVKLLLGVIIVVAILAVGWFAQYKGQKETLDAAKAQEEGLKVEFDKKAKRAASLPHLKKELADLEEQFAILVKQLPTDAEIPNLIQELNQAGSNNSLQMSSTRPLPAQKDGPVEILPYSISTTGTYDQFTKFAKDVGSLSRIVVLNAVNVTTERDGKLVLNARANTYKAEQSYAKQNADVETEFVKK
ncbi:MAG: type 4a pilus biogenesis protein PilO [Neisseriaceae bacterium]|nr:type 4a pilus biogenesis protein PilO [Neisseriaceae bacterium]MBR3425468.1 type 4a pilus biogenesis protein PilO [Neisseriaceae bacterium]